MAVGPSECGSDAFRRVSSSVWTHPGSDFLLPVFRFSPPDSHPDDLADRGMSTVPFVINAATVLGYSGRPFATDRP